MPGLAAEHLQQLGSLREHGHNPCGLLHTSPLGFLLDFPLLAIPPTTGR